MLQGGSVNCVGACVCVVDEDLHRGGFHSVDFDFAQVSLDHVMGEHGPAYFFFGISKKICLLPQI